MAYSCCRLVSRSCLSSIKSTIRSNAPKSPIGRSPTSSSSFSSSSRFPSPSSSIPRRSTFSSRAPSELGCALSLLPLHSAVALARMTSCLSTTSRSCRALSQELGLSVPR